MSEQRVIKRFIADGATHIFECGFVPDGAILSSNVATSQTPERIRWYRAMGDETTALYGILTTGSTGAESVLTTAASGISVYDEELHGVLIPAPNGGADQFRIPEQYSITQNYSSTYTQSQTAETVTCTARTASVAGTIIYPTTRNGFVYELKTATAAGTTEPTTWGTTVGEDTTDGGSNVWTCRTENVAIRGVKGLKLGATTSTDNYVCIIEAWAASDQGTKNVGDLANKAFTDPF